MESPLHSIKNWVVLVLSLWFKLSIKWSSFKDSKNRRTCESWWNRRIFWLTGFDLFSTCLIVLLNGEISSSRSKLLPTVYLGVSPFWKLSLHTRHYFAVLKFVLTIVSSFFKGEPPFSFSTLKILHHGNSLPDAGPQGPRPRLRQGHHGLQR